MYQDSFQPRPANHPDADKYLADNLRKITSSRCLLALLKAYLDEPDESRRQLLAAQIARSLDKDPV